jgi:hypothetical protein
MSQNNKPYLGGGITGISPKQTITNYKSSEQVAIRKVLTKSWNTNYASGTVNGHKRAIGPFRAVTNTGDFLSRDSYRCGYMPTPTQPNNTSWRSRIGSIIKQCDGTGIPPSSTNVKFVPDSSDYMTYKKHNAINQNYNDLSMGGDESNASQVAFKMNY